MTGNIMQKLEESAMDMYSGLSFLTKPFFSLFFWPFWLASLTGQVRKALLGSDAAVYSGYTCYTGIADFVPADINTIGFVLGTAF